MRQPLSRPDLSKGGIIRDVGYGGGCICGVVIRAGDSPEESEDAVKVLCKGHCRAAPELTKGAFVPPEGNWRSNLVIRRVLT